MVPRLQSHLDVSHFEPTGEELSLDIATELSRSERSSSAMGASGGSPTATDAGPGAGAAHATAPLLDELVAELCTADARHARCSFCGEGEQVDTSLPKKEQVGTARPRVAQCVVC